MSIWLFSTSSRFSNWNPWISKLPKKKVSSQYSHGLTSIPIWIIKDSQKYQNKKLVTIGKRKWEKGKSNISLRIVGVSGWETRSSTNRRPSQRRLMGCIALAFCKNKNVPATSILHPTSVFCTTKLSQIFFLPLYFASLCFPFFRLFSFAPGHTLSLASAFWRRHASWHSGYNFRRYNSHARIHPGLLEFK